MARVIFIQPDGTEHVVDAPLARSLMQIATEHKVPGILGECGGACSCGTCHVHIGEPWFAHLPAATETETFMLEIVPELSANSRLCCQVQMSTELDGVRVHVPSEQL